MARTEAAPLVRHRAELRRYQYSAVVLAVLALALGAALLPRGDELLLIHVRNRDVARARAVLADATGHQVSTAASVVAHNELHLMEGRVDEALTQMQAYARAHPDDAGAWKRLARLYADAQRLDDQTRTVAHVYRLEPSPELARRLATLHRWSGDEAAECAVLGDLVAGGQATTEEHLRAARLFAALGDPAKALATLERLRHDAPGDFDYATLELYASLIVETGGVANLALKLEPLPIVQTAPEVVVALARAFTSWGQPEAAVSLFEPPGGGEVAPWRLATRARVATGTTEAGRTARGLTALDESRPLGPEPLAALVDLLLSLGDYDAVSSVLAHPARTADPRLVGLAIGHAVSHGARERAQALVARHGDAGLAESPLLALELAVERGDVSAARRWIDVTDRSAPTSDQRAALAQFEARIGQPDRAYLRLEALVRSGEAPGWALTDMMRLAIEVNRVDQALHVLSGSPGTMGAWARLAATADRSAAVEAWLVSPTVRDADADTLRDVYHLLADRGRMEAAIATAEQLYRRHGTASHALLLGQALLMAGRPADALAPLRASDASDAEARLAYETALVAAVREGADVSASERERAVAVVADRLRGVPEPATEVRADVAYVLMEMHAPDAVLLPVLQRMALDAGGTWASAYDERLAAASRTAERVELWTSVGRSGAAAPEEQRRAAFRLVELGATGAAAAVFETLAADAGPEDVDLTQLLALWGPRADDRQIAWLVSRLRAATPADQPAWIDHIVRAGGAGAVTAMLAVLPADASPTLVEAWIGAHETAGDRDRIGDAIQQVLLRPAPTSRELRVVGRVALAHELPVLASDAFGLLAEREPGDREAMRWLGALAFYDGRVGSARRWLEAYAASGGEQPDAFYQLGEMARADGDADRARHYFERARASVDTAEGTAATRALLANTLVRLDDRARAQAAFEAVLAEDPWLDHVRADYVGALLQWGDYPGAGVALDAGRRIRRGDAASSGARRLDLLRVQWLTHEGRYGEALEVLDALAAVSPVDPDVLIARASFDEARGRAGAADEAYRQARQQAPQRDDLARLADQRTRERAPHTGIETEVRAISDGWDEQWRRATVNGRLAPDAPVSVTVEALRLSARYVRRADGLMGPLETDLGRFEATGAARVAANTLIGGALFGTGKGLGAGVRVIRDDLRGRTEVFAEGSRPFWEFLETAADDGRRDRVGVQRQWRLRADTAAWAYGAWHRYRLASGPRTDSAALTLGVVHTVRRAKPSLALQYGLDKEQRIDATVATSPEGVRVMPIPLQSREVHLFGAIARVSLAGGWEGEGTGGYTIDRLGGRGSFFTARLSPPAGARVGVALWAEHRLFAIATSQRVFRAGARIGVRF